MQQVQEVALVTGASRGLGLAIARLFAAQGIRLVLTARSPRDLQDAADELSAATEVLALAGDVADTAHADRLVASALERFGRIDVLVNNASTIGASPMPALEDYPLDLFEQVLRVNAVAPLHLMQLVLPGMSERGSGVIFNVTSDAAVNAYEGWGGYGAAKATLEHLSRVLAEELNGSGVRLYVVDPGDMNTRMHHEAEPGLDLSSLPSPEQVAPVFLRLLREERAPSGRFEARTLLHEVLEGKR